MKHGRAGHGVVQNGAFVVYYYSKQYKRMTKQYKRMTKQYKRMTNRFAISVWHKRHWSTFQKMLHDRSEWKESY